VGAKNSVLKLMAAAMLAEGTTTITNCPQILDVPLMADVLRSVGCEVALDGDTATITTPAELSHRADSPAMGKLRASVCVLGPLMGRLKQAVVALPGGDAIGSRPLDMHQNGLRKLGATSTIEHGCVVAKSDGLHGAQIWLDFPSVGATENILMAAVLAEGTTVIDNAAREPEISDICTMLTEMASGSPDVIVFELGDGLLGTYGVESILRQADIKTALTAVVLSANDPVAAWGGVKLLRERFGIEPSVVTGPATDNQVGVEIIREQMNVEAFNAISTPADLGDYLIARLGLSNVRESKVAGE